MDTTQDEETTGMKNIYTIIYNVLSILEEEPSLKSLSGKSSSIDTEKGSSEHFQKLHQYALQHMHQVL